MNGDGDRVPVLTMVDSIGAHGGAEILAMELALHLDRERFAPGYCVTRWEPQPESEIALDRLREAGIPFLGLERRSAIDLGAWRRFLRFTRGRTAILHTHKVGSNAWGSLLSPLAGIPVFVAHEHTWSFSGSRARKLVDRQLIARRADAFIAVSQADRDRMSTIEKIPDSKLRFIPNGIPTPRPPDRERNVRQELGIEAGAPVLGLVATLRPQKAIEVAIESMARVVAVVPDAQLLVVGGDDSGEQRPALEALTRREGLDRSVQFLGERSDIPEVVSSFDIGVLSSDFEGSPLSVMEYMEAGKPVVATAVGGVPDLVVDGETGLLVGPRDPNSLATAVLKILEDRSRAEDMGAAGRRRRREKFSIESTARAVERLYEELLARRA